MMTVRPLAVKREIRRRLAHRNDAARRGRHLERKHRLDGIDDEQRRFQPVRFIRTRLTHVSASHTPRAAPPTLPTAI
jgi:hypothetical protein